MVVQSPFFREEEVRIALDNDFVVAHLSCTNRKEGAPTVADLARGASAAFSLVANLRYLLFDGLLRLPLQLCRPLCSAFVRADLIHHSML